MTKRRILKWSLIGVSSLIVLIVLFGMWFMKLISPFDGQMTDYSQTTSNDLDYLSKNKIAKRGKILAVVTSIDSMGMSGKGTGFELTELSRAYYVFQANGFEVDIASTKGGQPPSVIDDLGPYDYAFLNDSIAQFKVNNSLKVEAVDPSEYEAIFFAGGKGAMWDFPNDPDIKRVVQYLYENERVVGAVCHGPAALVNVKLSDGSYLLDNKEVSSFTNNEELLLIKDARSIFPFLLQDKLEEQGATFNEGLLYLNNVVQHQKLITGQNPWSTWNLAESMISELGYTPKSREITAEEASVTILEVLGTSGSDDAKLKAEAFINSGVEVSRELIAMHSIMAVIQFDLLRSASMISVLKHTYDYMLEKSGHED